jgi:alpha-D-ribose 1-methylphosphonate 5-triphosphate synthase subunit PhnG
MDTATGRMVLRSNERGEQMVPGLQFWDHVKRNLDSVGSREAKDWARILRTRLDEIVPEYKNARAGAASFFGADNALEAGQNFVRQNFANSEVRQILGRMSPQEKQLFTDGFVSRFVEDLSNVADRRDVLNRIANSPSAREKLEIVMGPAKFKELETVLRVEGVVDFARSAVQGNSTTTRQLVELGLAGGTYGYGQMTGDASALTQAAVVWGLLRGHRGIDQRVARRISELLVSNDIGALQRGLRVVTHNSQFLNALRSADAKIARVSGAQAPIGAFQSPVMSHANDGPEAD